MNEKTITLPDREDMLKRLLGVCDMSHMEERFYPILLKNAGQERVASGVVMMLALAIHDYTEGMPAMMSGLIYMEAPNFIDALVDDKEVAEQAKTFLQQVLSKSS
jgi:hypothetical protein